MDISYTNTKSEIWKHCKELRTKLAKAEKAADRGPTELAVKKPKTVETQPVRLPVQNQLVIARIQVESALIAFQDTTKVVDAMAETLESVHNVDFAGGGTLEALCEEYQAARDSNRAVELALETTNRTTIDEATNTNQAALNQRRATIDEDRRVARLDYDRETVEKRAEDGRDRRSKSDEVRAIEASGAEKARLLATAAEEAWVAAESKASASEAENEVLIGKAGAADFRIAKASAAGTAQGKGIAAKQVQSKMRVVFAERSAVRAEMTEEIRATGGQVEVAEARVIALQNRIESARSSAINLASQSVVSKSDSGALAAVSEIALKQAAGAVKGK